MITIHKADGYENKYCYFHWLTQFIMLPGDLIADIHCQAMMAESVSVEGQEQTKQLAVTNAAPQN